MFWATVLRSKREYCWKIMPIFARKAFSSRAFKSPTLQPSTEMDPSSKGSSPLMHLRSVDLPAPLTPTRPNTSPSGMRRETPSSTRVTPKLFFKFAISIMCVRPENSAAPLRECGP